jgi:Leucine-rich repeat (LRR) protein
MLICCIAAAAVKTSASDHPHKPKSQTVAVAVEKRTLEFKSTKALGTLTLELAGNRCLLNDPHPVAIASGKATISVPENMRLIFEPNNVVIAQPKLMAAVPQRGIDVVVVQALELDESEKGECDRLIETTAKYLKELRELVVDASDVTDQGLAHLQNMPKLEAISTSGCHEIKGKCFPVLAKLPNIQRISCRGHMVDLENFKYLPSFPKLSYLGLRDSALDPAAIKSISQCSQLTDLELNGNRRIDDNCVAELSALKHLRRLDLGGTAVTDRSLALLSKFPELKTVDLTNTHTTLKGLALLKPLKLQLLLLTEGYSPSELKGLAHQVTLADHSKRNFKEAKSVFAPLH